jgi:hypothetical protein
MPIEKISTEFAPTDHGRQHGSRRVRQRKISEPQIDRLVLKVEDDAGGDPYNRTGQHCLADLEKRQR